MRKSFFTALLIGATLVTFTGCSMLTNGKVKDELITVKKDKAKKLDVELDLGLGQLNVSKGTTDWVEGIVQYSNQNLKPNVSYDLNGKKGEILIKQTEKNLKSIRLGKRTNDWNLKLNEDIPMNLEINAGASKTDLDLKGLNLQSLEIENGVGELEVDLGGKWNHSFETNIDTGVGKTTIILPSDVGVKIHANKGIGKSNVVDFISKGNGVYVNEAYENAKEILTVNMDMGVGEVTFKLE